jgi:ATP/maltotriose-dependent transcriptional regulator MalT
MQQVLTRLSARRPSNDAYLDRLVSSFPGQGPSTASKPHVTRAEVGEVSDDLTWRELEVLELLGERLSNKEIAERLYLSPLTVKRHTIAVYRKLQVTGRRQAVTRALALQLLPLPRATESAS